MENCVSDLRKDVERMNREMLHRMKKAGEYQREAIRALFPEEMIGHLNVIENEMKAMLMEVAAEVLKSSRKEKTSEKNHWDENASKTKKVDIV